MAVKNILCVCYTFGMPETVFMTQKQVVEERNRLRQKAEQMLKEIPEAKHIVYYWDNRDANDQIVDTHMYYTPIVLTDEQLDERTRRIKGFVGCVHRHE